MGAPQTDCPAPLHSLNVTKNKARSHGFWVPGGDVSCYAADDIHDDICLLEPSKLLFVRFAAFSARPLFRHFFFWGAPADLPFFCPFPSPGTPGGWALPM